MFRKKPRPSSDSTPPSKSQGGYAAHLRSVAFVLFYAVLANLLFWAASQWLGILPNGWIGLDYLAVGVAALVIPRFLSGLLMLLAVAADLLQGVCETYFFTPRQCLTNLDGLREFSGSRYMAMAGVVLLALVASFAPPYLLAPLNKRPRVRTALALIACVLVCASVDGLTILRRTGDLPGVLHPAQYSPTVSAASPSPQFRLSRIPTIRLLREAIFPAPAGFPMQSATALGLPYAEDAIAGKASPNFVLVLVESWGQATEEPLRNAFLQPYLQPALQARYRVLQGTVPFHGPTAAGEARELCGSTMGFHIMTASKEEIASCVPSQLASRGYRAIALHGMNGDFYTRSTWYRTIGFQDIWFEDRFAQQGLPTCLGSFTGICDASIAEWMGHKLQSDKANPDFLYWVTLNSHLPVLVPSPLKKGASCAFSPSTALQPSLCSWYQLEMEVHRSVANLAISNLGRPTVFVIVGDHAPPFSDSGLRSRFAPDVVPYVLLVPRSDDSSAVATAPGGSPGR